MAEGELSSGGIRRRRTAAPLGASAAAWTPPERDREAARERMLARSREVRAAREAAEGGQSNWDTFTHMVNPWTLITGAWGLAGQVAETGRAVAEMPATLAAGAIGRGMGMSDAEIAARLRSGLGQYVANEELFDPVGPGGRRERFRQVMPLFDTGVTTLTNTARRTGESAQWAVGQRDKNPYAEAWDAGTLPAVLMEDVLNAAMFAAPAGRALTASSNAARVGAVATKAPTVARTGLGRAALAPARPALRAAALGERAIAPILARPGVATAGQRLTRAATLGERGAFVPAWPWRAGARGVRRVAGPLGQWSGRSLAAAEAGTTLGLAGRVGATSGRAIRGARELGDSFMVSARAAPLRQWWQDRQVAYEMDMNRLVGVIKDRAERVVKDPTEQRAVVASVLDLPGPVQAMWEKLGPAERRLVFDEFHATSKLDQSFESFSLAMEYRAGRLAPEQAQRMAAAEQILRDEFAPQLEAQYREGWGTAQPRTPEQQAYAEANLDSTDLTPFAAARVVNRWEPKMAKADKAVQRAERKAAKAVTEQRPARLADAAEAKARLDRVAVRAADDLDRVLRDPAEVLPSRFRPAASVGAGMREAALRAAPDPAVPFGALADAAPPGTLGRARAEALRDQASRGPAPWTEARALADDLERAGVDVAGVRAALDDGERLAADLAARGIDPALIRSAADEAMVEVRALAAELDPGFLPGGLIETGVADGLPSGVPKVRKAGSEKAKSGATSPGSFRGVAIVAARNRRIQHRNQIARDMVDTWGVRAGDVGAGGKKSGAEIARAMTEWARQADKHPKAGTPAGYRWVAYDPTNIFDRVPVSQITPETPWIPEPLYRSLRSNFKDPGPIERLVIKVLDQPTSKWKDLVLAFSPRWQVGNVVGGLIVGSTAAGVNPLVMAAEFARAWDKMAPEPLPGAKPSRSYLRGQKAGGRESIPAEVLHSGMDRGMGQYLRDFEVADPTRGALAASTAGRQSLWRREADRWYGVNARVDDAMRAAIYSAKKKGGMADAEAVALAIKSMPDFRMAPWETAVMRRVFPFYPWMRHMTRVAFRLARDHPMRVLWTLRLGEMFTPAGTAADIPFLEGAVPTGDGFMQLGSLNPYGGLWFTDPREVAGSVNPFVNLGVEATTGMTLGGTDAILSPLSRPSGTGSINSYGAEGPRPLATDPSGLLWRAAGLTPQTRILRDALADDVARYQTGDPIRVASGRGRRPIPQDTRGAPLGAFDVPGPLADVFAWAGVPVSRRYDVEGIRESRREREERARRSREAYLR